MRGRNSWKGIVVSRNMRRKECHAPRTKRSSPYAKKKLRVLRTFCLAPFLYSPYEAKSCFGRIDAIYCQTVFGRVTPSNHRKRMPPAGPSGGHCGGLIRLRHVLDATRRLPPVLRYAPRAPDPGALIISNSPTDSRCCASSLRW